MARRHVPLDFRLRLLLRFNALLTRLGVAPTHEKLGEMPLAKRKEARPARWLTGPMPTGLRIADRQIAGRGGPVTVRTYEPPLQRTGVILYLHGGGWVSGGLDTVDYFCAHLAAAVPATVISVDYRLAPEAPYPAGLDDCFDALCWASDHAEEFGADPARLAVMGDSAGGNLAAALCLLARDRGGPAVAHQVLVYPGLDATLSSPSMSMQAFGLGRAAVESVVCHYLNGADPTDPLVSPLLAPDLSGLPPALIITADLDVVRDDGNRYAARLTEAGVPSRYTNYVRMPHGFLASPRMCRSWHQALAEIAQELALTIGATTSRGATPPKGGQS